jgi:hypothetical protein
MNELTIDPATGALGFGDGVTLTAGAEMAAAKALEPFWAGARDHDNGYAWLYFDGLGFGGRPCNVGLCFRDGRLDQASWGLVAPGADPDAWPDREAIDRETGFVRAVLREQLGRSFSTGEERFAWGEVWSLFDEKGFAASSGLRYR